MECACFVLTLKLPNNKDKSQLISAHIGTVSKFEIFDTPLVPTSRTIQFSGLDKLKVRLTQPSIAELGLRLSSAMYSLIMIFQDPLFINLK